MLGTDKSSFGYLSKDRLMDRAFSLELRNIEMSNSLFFVDSLPTPGYLL